MASLELSRAQFICKLYHWSFLHCDTQDVLNTFNNPTWANVLDFVYKALPWYVYVFLPICWLGGGVYTYANWNNVNKVSIFERNVFVLKHMYRVTRQVLTHPLCVCDNTRLILATVWNTLLDDVEMAASLVKLNLRACSKGCGMQCFHTMCLNCRLRPGFARRQRIYALCLIRMQPDSQWTRVPHDLFKHFLINYVE